MKRRAPALSAVLVLLGSLLPPGAVHAAAALRDSASADPAVPVASGTRLPFSGDARGDIVVDEARGHVFVSGGPGSTEVVVTDLDGQVLRTIPGLAGAEGMTLSRDGSTLFVALSDAKAVAVVDTETLLFTLAPAGDRCPRRATQVGADVYLTESCDGVDFRVMRVDGTTRAVSPVTLSGTYDALLTEAGQIVSHPAHPNRFYVADNRHWLSSFGSYRGVLAYEVDATDPDTATKAGGNVSFGSYPVGDVVHDLALSEDGAQLLVANERNVNVLSPSDLTSSDYMGARFGEPVAVSAAGGYAAFPASQPVPDENPGWAYVYKRVGPDGYAQFGRSYFFDGPLGVAPGSVELAGDRMFLVGTAQHGSGTRLYSLTGVATPGAQIQALGPGSSGPGDVAHIGGEMTVAGEPLAGRALTVTRTGPDGTVDLPPVTTAADGSFGIDDTPPGLGRYQYTVTFHGESGIAPGRDTEGLSVRKVGTSLSLTGGGAVPVGGTMGVGGRLLTEVERTPLPDEPVLLTDTHDGATTTLSTVTDADGAFSFEVTNVAAGTHVYEVRFDGDDYYAPTTRDFSQRPQYHVALEVTGPSVPYLMADQPVTLIGTLERDGEPFGGRTLRWQRSRTETDTTEASGTVTTAVDGTFRIETVTGAPGRTRWRVLHDADDKHMVAGDAFVIPVYGEQPVMEIATNRSRYEHGTDAEIAVEMISDAAGTIRLYVQPHGEPRRLVDERSVWYDYPAPHAFAVVPMTRNTRVFAEYEPLYNDSRNASHQYAPHAIDTSVPVIPAMQQTLAGSYGKDGSTYLVRKWVDPRLGLTTKPSMTGECVRVLLERRSDGAYRFVRRSTCLTLDEGSQARWTLKGDPPAGARFRMRYEWEGNDALSPRNARWVHVRFTR